MDYSNLGNTNRTSLNIIGLKFVSTLIDLFTIKVICNIVIGILYLNDSFSNFITEPVRIQIIRVLVFIISCILSIIYNQYLSSKVKWLSIGERISGRIIVNNEKQYESQYLINRTALYIVSIFEIVNKQGSVDIFKCLVYCENSYNFTHMMGLAFVFFIVLFVVYVICTGIAIWLYLPVVVYFSGSNGVNSYLNETLIILIHMLLSIIYSIIAYKYWKNQKYVRESPFERSQIYIEEKNV